ncbi:MAG: hypothetical protein JWQ29_2869, partial [Phenylobacterium sp.]|nr:hypothetical protein [Phenylobacterium sp.]
CVRPVAPTVAEGAAASLEQLTAVKTEVAAFLAASDAYQTCLVDDLTAQRAAAKAAKTKLAPEAVKANEARLGENQADKERVGASFNAAVKAYKAAHPS